MGYAVVSDRHRTRFTVVDISGGFLCKEFCVTDTEAKAVLIANLINQHTEKKEARREQGAAGEKPPAE